MHVWAVALLPVLSCSLSASLCVTCDVCVCGCYSGLAACVLFYPRPFYLLPSRSPENPWSPTKITSEPKGGRANPLSPVLPFCIPPAGIKQHSGPANTPECVLGVKLDVNVNLWLCVMCLEEHTCAV